MPAPPGAGEVPNVANRRVTDRGQWLKSTSLRKGPPSSLRWYRPAGPDQLNVTVNGSSAFASSLICNKGRIAYGMQTARPARLRLVLKDGNKMKPWPYCRNAWQLLVECLALLAECLVLVARVASKRA